MEQSVDTLKMGNPNPRPSWDPHNPHSTLGQVWVKNVRKIYHPVGFKKGYNFPLFVIFAGALFGFALSRFMYFDNSSVFSRVSRPIIKQTISILTSNQDAIPGEFYYYRGGHYEVGIRMHIITTILAAFFAPFQFVPIIRHKFILFHRINGYLAALLLVLGVASAFMIINVSIGGVPVMRVWIGLVGTMILIGLILAIVNIKRLQIEAHRMWMLRVWAWAGSIITIRILLVAGTSISRTFDYQYHVAFHCAKIFYMYSHVGVPD